MSSLQQYLEGLGGRTPDPAPTAMYAMLDHVATVSPSAAPISLRWTGKLG